jgi:hypothetical protein
MALQGGQMTAIVANGTGGRNILAIATGGNTIGPYGSFNQTQCEIKFLPTVFEILADVANSLITVSPVGNMTTSDIDPTSEIFGQGLGTIPTWVMRQFELLSLVDTSLYTSVVGDALVANSHIAEEAMLKELNATQLSDDQTREARLIALEDSITAMLDGVLLALSSAQLFLAPVPPGGKSQEVPVTYSFEAYKIGQASYIYASAGISVLLLLWWAVECVRIRFWDGLTEWDYRDMDYLIKAARKGASAQCNNQKEMKFMLRALDNGSFALTADDVAAVLDQGEERESPFIVRKTGPIKIEALQDQSRPFLANAYE